MPSLSDNKLWEQEQQFLKQEQQKSPELFVNEKKTPDQLLERIGILSYPKDLPKGYIKYSPLDFIVEEIQTDGTVVTVDGDAAEHSPEGNAVIHADLIKLGISTSDAVQRISEALHLGPRQIGYAGTKDAMALTGQRISIQGASPDAIGSLSLDQLFLKNLKGSNGSIQGGDLKGNRFTLFIRTEDRFDQEAFTKRVEKAGAEGIPNYVGSQRFGAPRFLAHAFGMHVLRGETKAAVEKWLTKTSPFELPYFGRVREGWKTRFGNWEAMQADIRELPHTFQVESLLLEALKGQAGGNVFGKAVSALPQQIGTCLQAYGNYLVNAVLSEAEAAGRRLPETIPLLMSQNPEAKAFYALWLKQHGTENYLERMREYGLGNALGKLSTIPSRIYPEMRGCQFLSEGVILSFDLPKWAPYATTVLMALFDVTTEKPAPDWVKTTEIDTKTVLQIGSLDGVRNRFQPVIQELLQRQEGE
ncbi:tRNA pseudouridine(13) synthase TruD [Candidatus Uhrbacteria bacterium]|nr:tRNA pseudouridine(13) synthase TruD [Candidatus Uhrbacteria bacterium]